MNPEYRPTNALDLTNNNVVNTSPTKPLNFPKQLIEDDNLHVKREQHSDINNKEFNSSSDTCISESESPRLENGNANTSFDRNFSFEDTDQVDRTIQSKIKLEDEEFSFIAQTPMTSTIDLNNPNKEQDKSPHYNNSSPNKSIMKRCDNSVSPSKKNVVFTNSTPKIHHYPANKSNMTNLNSTLNEETGDKLSHEWNELHKRPSSASSSDDNQTPPIPPRHTTDTFTSLLNDDRNNEDIDINTLNELKLKNNNYSSLSLNEKLDVFLSNKQVKTEDLDDHLNTLNDAAKHNTDSNIHILSLDLQKQEPETMENPLNSLMKSSEVQLKSGGSSQSSLQSLAENNRYLESNPNQPIPNKGIELNDGIKGFSNVMVESLIPNEEQEEGILHMKTPSYNRIDELRQSNYESENEEFHDSFDTNTEQSIMNLLNNASNNELNEVSQKSQTYSNVTDNKEVRDDIVTKANDDVLTLTSNVHIDTEQSCVKSELANNDESIKKELDMNYHDYEINTKIESVSDYGITHNDIKLVKSESRLTSIDRADEASMGDISEVTDRGSKFSIRDHIDSDWKFEDSNDGDREDNDDYTNNEFTAMHDRQIGQGGKLSEGLTHSKTINHLDVQLSPSSSQEFKDASDNFIGRTLAPRGVDEAIDATTPPIPFRTREKVIPDKTEDENVLANSSNIAMPGEITLPPVETHSYSSFDEMTQNIDKSNNSYEEMLSAEHEADNKPLDFISIWHSQGRLKKSSPIPEGDNYKSFLRYDETNTDNDVLEKVPIPKSLKPKNFKGVNVMSRRVVSPGFEDFHVSGFLPELSEDSGFENQFKSFVKNGNDASNIGNNSYIADHGNKNFTSLNTRNVLSNIDSYPNVIEPPKSRSKIYGTSLRNDKNLGPTMKQSRFKVPSFEIKRSTSTLSPRDQYNEIFEDVVQYSPTIKSNGMKTLPSMDRDDVKKILATKRVISQDEYSNVKLVGNNKKNSIVNEPNDKYDDLQQQASICNVSTESSPILDREILPHLASELMRIPSVLLSKDQFFNNNGSLQNNQGMHKNNSQDISRAGSVIHKISDNNDNVFPEPNLEMESPAKEDFNIFSSPLPKDQMGEYKLKNEKDMSVKDTYTLDNDKSSKKVTLSPGKDISPKKKNSPIKIGSPIRLVKRGSVFEPVQSPSKSPCRSNNQRSADIKEGLSCFTGDELLNNKLRNSPQKENLENSKGHEFKPSTVSVPSFYSEDSKPSRASSAIFSNKPQNNNYHAAWKEQKTEPLIQDSEVKKNPPQIPERGRLFLRVVGLKNIDLPDIEQHQSDFSITLDNGVHCIKTSNYKMGSHSVPINKEFELTVGDSLEFILTMKVNYEKPKGKLVEMRERKIVKSKNRLSRIFGSKDIITTTKFVPQDIEDSWADKFAQDGSFARCYVDLDQYESKITGEACNFDITCFNEWESYANDKADGSYARRTPYRIGQLEVKMLFIPRTEEQEILPTSTKSAYECISDINQEFNMSHDGYLHQEGGDCEIWKKRYFKLRGTSLIAHSEVSHKTRAKINLTKIVDVIYVDENDINKSSANYRNFSDVILVPHSFKIKFANGEIMDFGAPNRDEKVEWVSILEKIVYRNKIRRQPWVKLMLQDGTSQIGHNSNSRTSMLF